MNPHSPYSIRGKMLAFRYAWQGIDYMLRTQANAWIQIGITIAVTITGLWFGLSAVEWCIVALAIAGVWVCEALNTAIEAVVDLASPERHPLAGRAKDVAAGAVVVAVAAAGLCGLFIFGPRFWALVVR